MMTARLRIASWLATSLLALFGLFQGYTHGALPGSDSLPYGASLILTSMLLQLAGLGVGHLLLDRHSVLSRHSE